MSTIYELIGRFIVRLVWLRFSGQIKVAGGLFAVLVVAIGFLVAKRQPPEG